LDDSESRQRQALDNQTKLLEHDTQLLREVHEITLKFDRWKTLEQNRGAPQ
jgi:hypothetical protein